MAQRYAIRIRLKKWSRALLAAVEEHGRPNSFGVVEIAKEYGLRPRDGYDVGLVRLLDLRAKLGELGKALTYSKGRFAFEAAPVHPANCRNCEQGGHPSFCEVTP